MTYATEQKISGNNQAFLAVLNPRYLIETGDWTSDTGNLKYLDFDKGLVSKASIVASNLNNHYVIVEWTEVSSLADLTGTTKWFYDVDAKRLWINSSSPNLDFIIEYEIHISDTALNWHRNPTDSTTKVVPFSPSLLSFPDQVNSSRDQLFGFSPRFSGEISISNAKNQFYHLVDDDVGLNEFPVKIYNWFNFSDRNINDISLYVSGLGTSPKLSGETFDFSVNDFIKRLERSSLYIDLNRVADAICGAFSWTLDPNQISDASGLVPARTVYGEIDGLTGINLDYNASPSTSVNRIFFSHIAVSTGANVDPYPNTSSSGVVNAVKINGNTISPTDYTITAGYSTSNARVRYDYFAITLGANAESNAAISTFDPANDTLTVDVRGPEATVDVNGSSYRGSPSIGPYTSKNPASILLHYLVGHFGISVDDIDESSWATALTKTTHPCNLVLPEEFASATLETGLAVVNRILVSGIFRLFINNVGKIAISYVEPMGDADYRIEEEELLNAPEYLISYQDTARDVTHNFNLFETPNDLTSTQNIRDILYEVYGGSEQSVTSLAESGTTLLARYEAILRYPRAEMNIELGSDYYDINIGDVVQLNMKFQPGQAYTGSKIEKKYMVVGTVRSRDRIRLTVTDQRGIELNSGDF